MTTAEEELIKKRLLIEGDSGNDDRLINKLTKYFVKWTNSHFVNNPSLPLSQPMESGGEAPNSVSTNSTPPQVADEESTAFLNEQIVAALAHTEISLLRNQFILSMNRAEQENYELLYKKIDDEIEKAKDRILAKKIELQEARKIRKNRQEYDVIARQILAYPDRMEMQATIRNLEAKMENLKKSESECERKIELRRKQFGVVLESLSSLKNLIESDTNLEQYLSSQAEILDGEDDTSMMDVANAPEQQPAAVNVLSATAQSIATAPAEAVNKAAMENGATAVATNVTASVIASHQIEVKNSPEHAIIKNEPIDDPNDDGDDDLDVEKSEKHLSSTSNAAMMSQVAPEIEMEEEVTNNAD